MDIRIQGVPSVDRRRLFSVNVPGAAIEDGTAVFLTPGAINTNNPGVWSVATTNTPEPSCFLLLLTGLVSITGATRIGLRISIRYWRLSEERTDETPLLSPVNANADRW